ncbi:unnamed protein product [Lactuca saligna]|uniref:RanBP2-type domain-containing protein n=1 Tax=Lactuca saligna TaxID=75948 RepID=A0AA36ERT0_LACSI|nr:unnamed protein product [Lactuca saligna]
MVRASSRLLYHLTYPKSLLHHRPFAIFGLARRHSPAIPVATLYTASNHLIHFTRTNSLIPINFAHSFYSRATDNTWQDYNHIPANDYQVSLSHPWPEWHRLLESLSNLGYINWSSNIEDEIVANEKLSMEFVAAANSCLAFARDRPLILGWLRREDIELLINDCYPFLFKDAHETERRIRSFLQSGGSFQARPVDLMKCIVSYASNPIIYPERNIKEATVSFVRNLLQEMANISCKVGSPEQYQEQISRNLGPNITMKKGDWICPKCNFMNFARNTKCLECEELRPVDNSRYTKTIERGQNDRNAPSPVTIDSNNSNHLQSKQTQDPDKEEKVETWFKKMKDLHNVTDPKTSLSHEENKKTEIPFSPKRHQPSSSTYVPFVPFPPNYFAKKDDNSNTCVKEKTGTDDVDSRSSIGNKTLVSEESGNKLRSLEGSAVIESDPLDMSEEAKAERWFRRVAQIKDISELSQIPDEDFPSIMPMRKGVNRFVVSKRKTPLERRLTSPQYRKSLRSVSFERKSEGDDDN